MPLFRSLRRLAATCLGASCLVSAVAGLAPGARAGELTQYFPTDASGEVTGRPQSGWRISWKVLPPARSNAAKHGYGGSSVWEFQSIDFMRGFKADGSQDWVRVLNRLAMAEMYVPYHDNETVFLDVTQFKFPLLEASKYRPVGPTAQAKRRDDHVMSEVVDDHVRWLDLKNRLRRGQVLHLWTTMTAGNYRYLLSYRFADDGTINVRVGGSAQNYYDFHDKRHSGKHDFATHLHMGAWRMEFDLGGAESSRVDMIERVDELDGRPVTRVRPFNAGREGGEVWDAVKFSTLKVTSGTVKNTAKEPKLISYVLRPVRTGTVRTISAFSRNDFWVTRLKPDSPSRPGFEYTFIDVPGNVSPSPEPIEGKAVVVWYQGGLNHIVRSEDYDTSGSRQGGVAINTWTGFDLVPTNLWGQTPFFDREPGPAAAK